MFAVEDIACVLAPDHFLAQPIDVCMFRIPRDFRVEDLVHIIEKGFEVFH